MTEALFTNSQLWRTHSSHARKINLAGWLLSWLLIPTSAMKGITTVVLLSNCWQITSTAGISAAAESSLS